MTQNCTRPYNIAVSENLILGSGGLILGSGGLIPVSGRVILV